MHISTRLLPYYEFHGLHSLIGPSSRKVLSPHSMACRVSQFTNYRPSEIKQQQNKIEILLLLVNREKSLTEVWEETPLNLTAVLLADVEGKENGESGVALNVMR